MLERTFLHIPGVGRETEARLWQEGIDSWRAAEERCAETSWGSANRETVARVLRESRDHFDRGVHQYFTVALGHQEAWRAFDCFPCRTAFLDIETDGGRSANSVTMVGVYDGNEFRAYINGENLGDFADDISHFGYLVTFAGASFDLPMLRKRFPHVPFDQVHWDLLHGFRRLGIRGGLKRIEQQFGLSRSDETTGLGGLDAIYLWNRWRRFQDADARARLIQYNREDVENLRPLARICFDLLRETTLTQAARLGQQMP